MDDQSPLLLLLSIVAALVLSAFFSGMEIAFVTSNKLKIELDKKLGLLPARVYSYFFRNQSKYISTLLVGNNVALVVYGIFMADWLEDPIRQWLAFIPDQGTVSVLLLVLQTMVSTLVIMVFAEFLPKLMFRINPNRKLEIFTLPVLVICGPLYALVWLVFMAISGIMRIASVDFKENRYSFGRVDLDHYVKEAASVKDEESEIENELEIFQNALDFSSIKARECMIPRNEIEALNVTDSITELKAVFIGTGFSKLLIYEESIDNVIGYVHSFDLFRNPQSVRAILRPLAIVPETTTADKVLKTLIEQKKNVALVVDEYGGTSGMLTLEDIVEEIFGEIEDEHDKIELVEEKTGEGMYRFSARLEIDYLNKEYDLNLPEHEDYETLAGLIIHRHEDLPEEGEVLKIGAYTVEIKKVSDNKIDEVILRPSQSAD